MIKWLQNRIIGLAMATSKVEKNAFNNDGSTLSDNIGIDINHKVGFLSHSLINGELTEEVKNLRWRMYKTLDAMESVNQVVIGYEKLIDPEDGSEYDSPIMGAGTDSKVKLRKVKVDDFDDYPLFMVINNDEIISSMTDRMSKGETDKFDHKVEFTFNEIARYKPEDFLIKLNIRKIDDDNFLGELYFSKYHDGNSPTHALFIKELERSYNRKKIDYLFDIEKIGFITNLDIGVNNNKGIYIR